MNQEEIIHDVQKRLFEMQDAEYRDFHAKLVPTMEKTKFIGIRTPMLRKFAKKFGKTEESEIFLQVLPHQYYEENNLHGLLIEQIRDYDKCLEELVKLKQISNGLIKRIHQNYRVIVGFNMGLIILGVAGILQPTTSALFHNTSTLLISLKSMTDLLPEV